MAAVLVFFMQPGFAMLEAGLTRGKNAGNIVMKNFMNFSLGTLAFWIVGFSLLFGRDIGGFIGCPISSPSIWISWPGRLIRIWPFCSSRPFSVP